MEVKLIAMTDAVMPDMGYKDNGLYGEKFAAEYVCDHAARACTSADLKPLITEDDTYLFWEDDNKKALKAALKSGHKSILEHAVYTFEVKGVSRALTHQLVRHRIASYSQQSQRYVNMDGFDYVMPESIEYAVIEDNDTEGGDHSYYGYEAYEMLMDEISKLYKLLIDRGVPEEDARYILPNACTTNIIVTMNARSLLNLFRYRICERAQWEIRELAEKMLKICKEVSPTIFEDAGPRCVQLGYCPEAKSCGRMPKKEESQ